MKFAAALIKIFSGTLSAIVFGAFLYYTYQYQISKDTEYLFTANMALIVFLISSVCFALLFVLFDVYQSKNTESDLVKLLKSSDLNGNSEKTNIADLLVKIASSSNMTNQILDGHFKELNNGLNTLNNSSEINGTNFQATLDQLTVICGEISQYVDSIKNENVKENQRAAGHSGNFDVLVTTVSRLSSDLNNLNGRLLDVVNQISKNVTASIQSHTDIDNEIKELLQKILLAKNGENPDIKSNMLQSPDNNPQPAEDETNESEPQSVADFYEQHFKDIQENEEEKNEAAPAEISADADVLNENENRIDELLTTPVSDEVITPQSLDLTEHQSEIFTEDKIADDAALQEAQNPWEQPMADEIHDAEQEYSQSSENTELPILTADDTDIMHDNPETTIDSTTNSETSAKLTENQNTDVAPSLTENSELPAEIESSPLIEEQNKTASGLELASYEKPVNEPYFEQTPVKNSTNDFSLEASDPFNPSPEHYADISLTPQTADEEPVSLDAPNKDSNVKLDDIFNDNFAMEMADLDILKDDNNNKNTGEISVEDLLADDKDPYNPNK